MFLVRLLLLQVRLCLLALRLVGIPRLAVLGAALYFYTRQERAMPAAHGSAALKVPAGHA